MSRVLQNILMLFTCLFMIAGAAVVRYGTVAGIDAAAPTDTTVVSTSGDTTVINTTSLCKDVSGYAGATPLAVYITDGRIDSVETLPNVETPRFFERARKALIHKWDGLTVAEARALHVDGATGATYSSRSVIANMNAALDYAASSAVMSAGPVFEPTAGFFVALAVVLCGCIVPLFVRSHRYRVVQLIMNVVVLGFWTGSFINYTAMIGLVGRGVVGWGSLILILMLIAAFIYPVFGRSTHYCLWLCPFGSLQELLGMSRLPKIHLSAGVTQALEWVRRTLWAALMLALWVGGWFAWTDYELFTAFMLDSAVTGVIVAAIVVCVLSLFIHRPYCRFVCPTGTLFKISESK